MLGAAATLSFLQTKLAGFAPKTWMRRSAPLFAAWSDAPSTVCVQVESMNLHRRHLLSPFLWYVLCVSISEEWVTI